MLKNYCNEKNITIAYAALYILPKNGITEKYLRTLAIMKDSLFIKYCLPVNFWAKIMDSSNYLYNRLSKKDNNPVFILEKAWTSIKQNLEHV